GVTGNAPGMWRLGLVRDLFANFRFIRESIRAADLSLDSNGSVPATLHNLPVHLQRELASAFILGRRNPSECPGALRHVRIAELGTVKRIVEFGAKLDVHSFAERQREALRSGQVGVERMRSVDQTAAGVSD